MKTYHGHAATETVTVRDLSTGEETPLTHYVRHSPDGFLWGYAGSGPAELARCLIIDALGTAAWDDERHRAGTLNPPRFEVYGPITDLVEQTHQSYKERVISQLPRDQDWTLTQNSILTFVRHTAEVLHIGFAEPLGVPVE